MYLVRFLNLQKKRRPKKIRTIPWHHRCGFVDMEEDPLKLELA